MPGPMSSTSMTVTSDSDPESTSMTKANSARASVVSSSAVSKFSSTASLLTSAKRQKESDHVAWIPQQRIARFNKNI